MIVSGVLILIRRRAVATSTGSAPRHYWRSVLVVAGVVTVLRVGICWYLTYRAFSHYESLSEIPLIVLLMPEYLLTPGDPATPQGMWCLTAALVIGTFVMVTLLALVVWSFVGRARLRSVPEQ